ncbi:aa3-type cytochrome c oxidase subunit IV [Amaricoccus sp.]|uniref:aa3-type cytochrome c oxidase subunit IV n=1 Tax=Amaricoccus sp. TaxID=1872485 RepID=UPI001B623BD2|nr:aa3-type cytochrome c oxidase subunit IV [Amaricoccus sp.]MBP7241665.1 aa3-type cytochrome c oxidase subunit IV [Amaricoccus sp.]
MADHSHAHAPAHEHGTADVAEHQQTFEAFARFWVYLFGAAAAVLIFLAIFNS